MIDLLARGLLSIAALSLPALAGQSLDPELVRSVEKLIHAEIESQHMVGVSVAIGVDGEMVWSQGFGLADVENDVPATEQTVYRLASISKPVTAAAVMQLVEQGKLDLDGTVSTYVADWPEKRWPITIRQLLGHQGGVRHYADKDVANNTKAYATCTESLEYFADDPLIAEPGTEYSYTTFGFNLLGAAVEGASGMSFMEYLVGHVFPLAGTSAMQDDSQSRIIKHRARGYAVAGAGSSQTIQRLGEIPPGELCNAMLVDVSYKVPGGGLCSTAADLVRFTQSMEAGRLVKPKTRDLMWTAQKTRDGTQTNYGMGWITAERAGSKFVVHTGAQAGASTSLILLRDAGVVVAVMCNTEGTNPGAMGRRIALLVESSL